MANLSSAHQQFFQRCNGLSSQFSDLNQRINHKQAALISQMQIVIDSTVTLAKNANKNDPIQAVLQENVLQITQRLTDWQQQVASYQAQLALRSGIDDSLLVFVCGKVKAGKSALGNYVVSWGEFKADDVSLDQVAQYHQAAIKLLDEVKFDL